MLKYYKVTCIRWCVFWWPKRLSKGKQRQTFTGHSLSNSTVDGTVWLNAGVAQTLTLCLVLKRWLMHHFQTKLSCWMSTMYKKVFGTFQNKSSLKAVIIIIKVYCCSRERTDLSLWMIWWISEHYWFTCTCWHALQWWFTGVPGRKQWQTYCNTAFSVYRAVHWYSSNTQCCGVLNYG